MDHNVPDPMILAVDDQVAETFEFSSPTDPPQVDTLLSMPSSQENCNNNGGFSFNGQGDRRAETIEDGKKMKIIHRETERQRRQEMNTLYGSLRSQLPCEYLQGKRSIADHMNEAVKYIKHLENTIKELKERRDERQNGLENRRNKAASNFSTTSDEEDTVAVISCGMGLQVSINTAYAAPEQQQRLSLSRVLRVLNHEEGLNVISYSSVKVHPRLLHSVHCEITDAVKINVPELQLKIENLRQP